MNNKIAPPANLIQIDDVFHGPPIGHGNPKVELDSNGKPKKGCYYVRAIIDPWDHPEYGPQYQIVFRFYTRNKGWCYMIENSSAIAFDLFKPAGKAKKRISSF